MAEAKRATDHVPAVKRLSGDFAGPLELLGSQAHTDAQKRQILEVWLTDLAAQPDDEESRQTRAAIREALQSLGDTRSPGDGDVQSPGGDAAPPRAGRG